MIAVKKLFEKTKIKKNCSRILLIIKNLLLNNNKQYYILN